MKASIIIINYNDKQRVKRAIESCINQSWQDKEIIVVDDGSDEETRALYKDYSSITLIQLERDDVNKRTPSRARNAGAAVATGEYIAFLDSDNYYETTFLEDCIKADSDIAFVNWEITGLQNYKCDIEKVWDFRQPVLQNYLQFQHVDHQCLLIKKSYLDKCGYYDERLPRSQDCDLIARLILNGGYWHHVSKKLFVFEKHEEDQNKQIASIYGKTLWTLKNNINYTWLIGLIQGNGEKVMSYYQAIHDFTTSEEWAEDYKNSEFKEFKDNHSKILYGELSENGNSKI